MKKLYDLAEGVRKCTSCPLWKKRFLAVPGEGRGKIMLVGDTPGPEEDRQGLPFIWAEFENLLKLAGLKREEVFVTYCVKCYSPEGFGASELDTCQKWLDAQREIIKPTLIIVFGEIALQQLTGKKGVTDLHGQMVEGKYFVTSWDSAEEDFKKLKSLV